MGIAFADVVRHRLDWIRVYEKTYGVLVLRVGKRQAERFFKPTKRKRKKTVPSA